MGDLISGAGLQGSDIFSELLFAQLGTSSVKGSWVEMIASTPRNINSISLYLNPSTNQLGANIYFFVDIGIGPAGSEIAIIPDIVVRQQDNSTMVRPVLLPISIPKGTRISIRGYTSSSLNASMVVTATGHTHTIIDGESPSAYVRGNWIGIANAVHPTEGAWAQLTAGIPKITRVMSIHIFRTIMNADNIERFLDIGIGPAGSEVVLIKNIVIGNKKNSTESALASLAIFTSAVSIPANTRIAIRTSNKGGTTDILNAFVLLGS